jgi:hypothetical protein
MQYLWRQRAVGQRFTDAFLGSVGIRASALAISLIREIARISHTLTVRYGSKADFTLTAH